ncbi:winged helix DNA-binding domain-containing protein [Paractinoplanes rishiriensis]|uniref:Winged helix DNA-binding domain-containing protein n=1 Tax=Paractinoplanes rishiriensis TaxID=1050105 RepID=A0A919MXF2_9ACTN|nr:winged helix DNA-binding domain-containing protein [Actinoplanes rishiriensis]GIE95645.1 hypothetical protein Ari01nite_31100 [Actinoplanes rishiriensis]
MTVLDNRTLNRALMHRQLLLSRRELPVAGALTHLVGLQAQEPMEPYVGLWSRLTGFRPDDLVAELEGRRAVRTLLMRRTLHLVTAADCLALRELHQPMLAARMLAVLKRDLTGVDPAELTAAGRPHFARTPSTLSEVGRAVGDRWPDVPARVLGDALSSLVPLVQVPPRGVWGQKAPARNTTIEAWLGTAPALAPTTPPPAADTAPSDTAAPSAALSPSLSAVMDELLLRYLAAFGPATSSDMRAWSGLSGLRESFNRLRPQLRTFRDLRGRELFDIPDGVLPDPDIAVPPRFLPAFDNAVLGFDDRSRIIGDAHRSLSVAGARFLLIDGRVAGTWTIDAASPELRIDLLTRPAPEQVDAAVAEGECLLAWHTGPGKVVVSHPQ